MQPNLLPDASLIDTIEIPSSIRFPEGGSPKHLLRETFVDLLRPALRNQKKLGFTLPIGRWMAGKLRPLCESSLDVLKNSGIVRTQGVDSVWRAFLSVPESQMWSRALSLVVLGDILQRNRLEG